MAGASIPTQGAEDMESCLPLPRALEGDAGGVHDVAALGGHVGGRGPGGAGLDRVVDVLDLDVVLLGRERRGHVAALLDVVIEAELEAGDVAVLVVARDRGAVATV